MIATGREKRYGEMDFVMIKLLIVDDERTIRNGLARHIDWESLGIDMVQSAESAEEALSVCALLRPNIVLSDIRMRGMGGIEMCTRIHEQYPDCQIIFVSGYADKEYLKAAISLGAVDYIEKPVSPELLAAAVRKAVAACAELQKKASADVTLEESRAYIGQVVLQALAHNDYPENFERSVEISGLFPRVYEAYRFCVLRADSSVPNTSVVQKALCDYLDGLPAPEHGGTVYGAFLDDRNFCILLCGGAADIGDDCAFLQALRQDMMRLCVRGKRFFLACGSCVPERAELYRSYDSLHSCMRELFFKGWGRCAVQAADRPIVPVSFDKNLLGAFSHAFSKRDERAVGEVLAEIYASVSVQTDANPDQIRNIYYSIDYLMNEEYERRMLSEKETGESGPATYCIGKMQAIETLTELRDFVLERAHHMLDLCRRDDENGSAVVQVIRIMRTNYADKNLSVKSLAESVYLTPTYLSGLFKKRTGKTIGQYLTEIRIEYSMKLLMDKQLKLYHIAEMVGYDDPNYYAKIFKRHVGMTPSEFREKKLP
ncbi:MAG: response regulator [Hominenteromicrobium sp.]